MRYAISALLLWCSVEAAVAPSKARAVFEAIPEVPEQWTEVGKPADDTQMLLNIVLAPERPQLLEKTLYDVSTPGSEKYGQYLSQQEIKQLIKPTIESKSRVLSWLQDSGATITKDDGEKIQFTTTLGQADLMLGTSFKTYSQVEDPENRVLRTLKVTLPVDVAESISLIHPTTYFQQVKSIYHSYKEMDSNEAQQEPSCSSVITPTCLENLYGIRGVKITDPKSVGFIGVPGFLRQVARYSDLNNFIANVPNRAKGSRVNFTASVLNDGSMAQSPNAPSTEANLDIQYTVSLTYPMRNHFYAIGKTGPLVPDLDQPDPKNSGNEPFNEYFTHLLEQDSANLPHTVSISYGEPEQSSPDSYAKAVCSQIAQLGTRGVSVLSGSGDWGPGSACQTNDALKRPYFTSIFPAACPYITSVGGTYGINPERAVSFSSGGFSDKWERPAYQEKQVSAFLAKNGDKFSKYFNAKGRGFPDIAAQGKNFRIYDKGKKTLIGGTSASAPVVASIIALLNAKRLQDKQPTLGFLNPWLYSVGDKVTTDIVAGQSNGCFGRSALSGKASPKIAGASWPAIAGWDPSTGLGTPKFQEMLKNLPAAKAMTAP